MFKKKLLLKLAPANFTVLALFFVLTLFGSNVTTFASENQKLEQGHCIIIDAGHGRPDGGATSCTGTLESDINLQIAKRLESIMHLLGYKTLMIREDENAIFTDGNSIASKKVSDIRNRVNLVNSTKGAILVSIHQNYFSDSRYSGAQVFYAGTENSKDLGLKMQEALIKWVNRDNNRQPKKASGIYLMEKILCTGILIECGFLSNSEEAILLENDSYQKKLCSAIGVTLGSYINDISTVS